LALLNAGEALLALAERVEFIHFAEAGYHDLHTHVDVALVEGSITCDEDLKRLKTLRANCDVLITMGACATSGGLQALREGANLHQWLSSIYPSPEWINTLPQSTPIAQHVHVDAELWGCPITSEQIFHTLYQVLAQTNVKVIEESVCLSCKRQGYLCVLVQKNQSCLGPVTQGGCGALCPSVGRACYGCFGPKERANTHALGEQFLKLGEDPVSVAQRFKHINHQAPLFKEASHYFNQNHFKGIKIVQKS
jgi:sulfhydrogenase subunit delta